MLLRCLVLLHLVSWSIQATDCQGLGELFGNDCLEPHPEKVDRLSAQRICQKNRMVLYYPYNQFATTRMQQIAQHSLGNPDSIWIGVTCTTPTTCYNDQGYKIDLKNNYTQFTEDPINAPCFYMATNKGYWFGNACRGQSATDLRPFICWNTRITSDLTCPSGTFLYKQKCYGLHGVADSQVASDHCHAEGGELVSIHSKFENEYVFYLATASIPNSDTATYGIGMYTDNEDEYWFDGSDIHYTNFGVPDLPPIDGYPTPNSTIYVYTKATKNMQWFADPARTPRYQICTWPPYNFAGSIINNFTNYCGQKDQKLPSNTIIYSPGYPDYTLQANCALVYNGQEGEEFQLIFQELYLGENSKITLYNRNGQQIGGTILYNTKLTTIYSTDDGFLRLVFTSTGKEYNYWSATTIPQGGRIFPVSLDKSAVCGPRGGTLALSTKQYSQFQTSNYGSGGMDSLCTITITALTATNTVVVTFYDFYIGPLDEVFVIDGTLTDQESKRKLLNRQPGTRIESTGQHLTFQIFSVSPNYRGIWADFTSN